MQMQKKRDQGKENQNMSSSWKQKNYLTKKNQTFEFTKHKQSQKQICHRKRSW